MNRLLYATLALAAMLGFARAASAQYMYLDTNGNGVHDSGDRLNPNGTPTTVDLYIRTNQNRDGSTAVCDVENTEPLTINTYFIDLTAVGGVVTYSGFINRQPTMTTTIGELNPDGVRYKNGFGGPQQLAPGQYRLATLTITGMAGAPRVDIVDLVSGSLDFTGFGTQCFGVNFDNVYRLDGPNTRAITGIPGDFTDADGLGPAFFEPGSPVLGAIGNKTVDELSTLAFTATATDPNLGAILTFTLDPGMPPGSTIQASTGIFRWIPAESQGPGVYPITVRVTNNSSPPLSDVRTFMVTVNEVNMAPVLNPIGNKTVTAGSPLAFTVTAADPDIPPNTLCFSLDPTPPPGVTINCGTGAFFWIPTPAQTGAFTLTVRVTDNGIPALSSAETITVLVLVQSGAPTADAGGPYTGIVNAPLSFDGTGSSDPNGDPLTYLWNFGDGLMGSGAVPFHTYTAPGTYIVTLRVTDPAGNFDDDTTTATIQTQVSVGLVLRNGGATLTLDKNAPVKVALENSFISYPNVLTGSLRLSTDYPNAGTVSECAADPKQARVGDLDRDNVADLEARFSADCMRSLFQNTPNNTDVNLILTGEILTPTGTAPLRGVKVVTIKKGGGGALVSVRPNPMNPQAIFSFVTAKAGDASVQLFDLQGRLVRTVLPRQHLDAGAHDLTIDGRNDQGVALPSGIYFYRLVTAESTEEGSITVLK